MIPFSAAREFAEKLRGHAGVASTKEKRIAKVSERQTHSSTAGEGTAHFQEWNQCHWFGILGKEQAIWLMPIGLA